MKVSRIILSLTLLGLITNCVAYDWKKWHEELDLAFPEQLLCNIKMEKRNILEGEPLLVRCVIVNRLAKPAKIVMPASTRNEILDFARIGYGTFMTVREIYSYRRYIHIDVSPGPMSEKLLFPKDTLYVNGILGFDNFFSYNEGRKGYLPIGDHNLFSTIFLGAKFYPKPPRILLIYSDTIKFTVKPAITKQKDDLAMIRPYMKEFFGYGEANVSDSCRQLAYPVLNKIRKTNSYLASYADFIYISMLAFDSNKSEFDKAISEAKGFIEKHQSSILGEEMEFLLVRMLHRKEGKSKEFYKQAQLVLGKYPKNINCFGVKKLLEGK